jgi:Pectic acid lyase
MDSNNLFNLPQFVFFLFASCAVATNAHGITWDDAQRKNPQWFTTQEGQRVVENVLLYQLPSGGWPKNIDMAAPLSAHDIRQLSGRREKATIDNGATYSQLRFLANAFQATRDEQVREAFLKGLDFLFEAQYDNGGWPIYYPLRGGYDNHIHFNDNSVSGVLMLMDDVDRGEPPFD